MNQFHVEVHVEKPEFEDLQPLVQTAVVTALTYEEVQPPAEVTVLLTDDAKIQRLNKEFLGEDKVTDVLSFPAGGAMPGADTYLGDIAVSVPTAERQAKGAGHDLADELQLLTVHAVLHLLGYDHAETDEKNRMWSVQKAILTQLSSGDLISSS
jgi:probable rRNA maturation factor